ncbi:MAG: zf-HC2 domain-containing protein [candidate division Zixibacteria bacterium]
MNCKEVLRQLYEIIDKEAGEIDSRKVEEHLKLCRHCMAHYEFERTFRAFVIEKGRNVEDTSSIKKSIRNQLDAIDAAGEVGQKSPFRWQAVSLAAAAALIICIIAAYSLTDFQNNLTSNENANEAILADSRNSDIGYFIGAFSNHKSHESKPVSHASPLDYLYDLTGIRLDPIPEFSQDNILSVSVDTIMNIPFGCLEMLNQDNDLVTVFIAAVDDYTLPEHPRGIIDGHEYVVHRCEKCTLVGTEKKDLIFMVVSGSACQPKELADMTRFF